MKGPTINRTRRRLPRNGSALIAVLWVVAILSLAVFSATQFLFVELESNASAGDLFRAEQLADRGIALAAHPGVDSGDPLLRQDVGAEGSFFARVASEGGRLPLNALLEHAARDRPVLEDLFVRWGLRRDEAVDVVDNLVDWVDPDDEPTDAGAEGRFYHSRGRRGHPFNRPFSSLDEVMLVHQFQRVASVRPDWRDSFTLMSSGRLDLNEAPPELIAVTSGVGEVPAERFVEVRNGFDQVQGTGDDVRFESVDSALEILVVPEDFAARVAARVSIDDPVKRLVSVGRHGSIAVERTVTITYTDDPGEILRWSTRRIE